MRVDKNLTFLARGHGRGLQSANLGRQERKTQRSIAKQPEALRDDISPVSLFNSPGEKEVNCVYQRS